MSSYRLDEHSLFVARVRMQREKNASSRRARRHVSDFAKELGLLFFVFFLKGDT